MKAVLAINGIILFLIFFFSSLLVGLAYRTLKFLSGPYYFEIFSFFILVSCLLLLYVLFLHGVLVYYKLVLMMISQKVLILSLSSLDWEKRKQILRVILNVVLVGLLSPINVLLPLYLKFAGGKIGKSPLLRGKIYNPELVELGDNVILGEESCILGHLREGDVLTLNKIRIGTRVTIGTRCTIFPGVEIGDDVIIAAGAVVTKNTKIPSGEIWGGIPARKVRGKFIQE